LLTGPSTKGHGPAPENQNAAVYCPKLDNGKTTESENENIFGIALARELPPNGNSVIQGDEMGASYLRTLLIIAVVEVFARRSIRWSARRASSEHRSENTVPNLRRDTVISVRKFVMLEVML
jgi:hypothetical protein